jgi:hypothetical protein
VVLTELEERRVGFVLGYRPSSLKKFSLPLIHPTSGRLLRSFNIDEEEPLTWLAWNVIITTDLVTINLI